MSEVVTLDRGAKGRQKRPSKGGAQQEQQGVHVFISYASEDTNIAETLRNELIAFDLKNVSVFHDASDLRTGTEWMRVLKHELACADWLIAVHTGRRKSAFSFPGWEVGAFTALRDQADHKQIFCLHDTTDIPELFRNYQNRRVVVPGADTVDDGFYKNSDLYKFLTDFEQLCRTKFSTKDLKGELGLTPVWEKIKLDAAKSITASFVRAQHNDVLNDYFPQRRLVIEVDDGNFYQNEPRQVPPAATVRVEANAYALIGVPAAYDKNRQVLPYTWGQLSAMIRANAAASWMDHVNEVIIHALRNNSAGDQLSGSFLAADGRVYRPILSRHQLLKGGARRFYVDFIQAYPRRFPGDELTSQLLIGLVFASRFRFMFFEMSQNSYNRRLHTAGVDELPILTKQLTRDLDRLPIEAAEFGLTDLRHLGVILGGQHEATVEHFFETWKVQRGHLGAAISQFQQNPTDDSRNRFIEVLDAFSAALSPLNKEFIRLVLDRYRDVLGLKAISEA